MRSSVRFWHGLQTVYLARKGHEPVGIAARDHLVAGDRGIEIVTGGDDGAEIISHDYRVQFMGSITVEIGILEDLIVIVFCLACRKEDHHAGEIKKTLHLLSSLNKQDETMDNV